MITGRERILAALDVSSWIETNKLVTELAPYVGGFKVGSELATSEGAPQLCSYIEGKGSRTFLDLKYHDIPNTVKKAAAAAARLNVLMFNVHTAGGSAMMRAAVEGRDMVTKERGKKFRPLLIGVTVLTSMKSVTMEEIGYQKDMPVAEQVVRLAVLAANSGMDGVVASAKEAVDIRAAVGNPDFVIVTPAIRPQWATWIKADDQNRPATHIEAVLAGADYLVVGRPLLESPNPAETAIRMAAEMDEATAKQNREVAGT